MTDNLIQSGKEIINENIIELQYSSISASVIQMINRGSCRKIVKGNAPVMKVAMLMPKNKSLSKVIVNYIKEEMTGIYVTNVDSDLIMSDNVNIKAGRLVDSDHDLIECITNANAKRMKLSEAFKTTGITTKKKQDRVRKQMGDSSTKLGSELYDAGYKLVKDGQYQVIKG